MKSISIRDQVGDRISVGEAADQVKLQQKVILHKKQPRSTHWFFVYINSAGRTEWMRDDGEIYHHKYKPSEFSSCYSSRWEWFKVKNSDPWEV